MERPRQADVVIVGNGALGLFLANELMERQIGSVVVIGPTSRSTGASQAAGAMLGCFAEATTETLRTDAARDRFEIGVHAHDLWPAVLGRLEEFSSVGHPLRVAADAHIVLNAIGGELDSTNFAAIIDALDKYGKPWSEVDPKEIPGFRPRTDARALRAIHVPGEGAVDARGVIAALEARLRQSGVTLVNQEVSRLTSSGDRVTGVELADGHLIEAAEVVVAAGVHSESLVRTVLDDFDMMPTFPGLGFAMIARRTGGEPFQSVVRTPNRGFACGLHVVPAGDGYEYYGATNRLVDVAADTTWLGDVRFLTQYSMQQLDEQVARHEVTRWLVGNRPVTLDGFPLIGRLPMPGLYLMTGTYRDGFHCAPLLASHVSNELQGKLGIISSTFTPVRQPIVTRTIEESIESYVQHSLAAWFETGAEAAPQMTTRHLGDYYRALAMDTYTKLDIDYALGPDILWYAQSSLLGARRIVRYLRQHSGRPAGSAAVSSGMATR